MFYLREKVSDPSHLDIFVSCTIQECDVTTLYGQMRTLLQLFRVRFSYERGKAYVTTLKVIMGNGGFTVAWLNLKVFQRGGRTHHKHVYPFFLLPCCWITLKLNQQKPCSYYPVGIVSYAFTLLWENLCLNSCLPSGRLPEVRKKLF